MSTIERKSSALPSLDQSTSPLQDQSTAFSHHGSSTPILTQWSKSEKLVFRWFFLFAIVLIIPFDSKYLKQVAALKWSKLTYVDVDLLSNFYPWAIDYNRGNDYIPPLRFLGISLALAIVWSLLDRQRKEYNTLYYWLRVIIRYKLAGVMFYFAFIKVFPVQMPFPTVSQLNTIVGDYTPGRLFWIATGSAPGYEIFGGVMELAATVLLLWRRTVTLGAFLMAILMVPIVAINVFYDTGVQIKSILILILALFLLVDNVRELWNFLVLGAAERLKDHPAPALSRPWQRNTRIAVKTAFFLFFFGFRAISVATAYHHGKSFKLPEDRGLPQLKGIYLVRDFQLNGHTLPFDPLDSTRWQNLAFEEWNTISIKVTRPVRLQVLNNVRKTEIHSNAGRHYYAFRADTVNNVLYLKNRADTSAHLMLQYALGPDGTIRLHGLDERKDTVDVLLKKIEREYPLIEGREAKTYITY